MKEDNKEKLLEFESNNSNKDDKLNLNSKNKKMAKGYFSLLFLNFFLFSGNIIISLIVPIFLNLEQVGVYKEIFQYFPLVSVFVLFGMVNTSSKFITKYDSTDQKSKSSAVAYYTLILNCVISLVFMILFIIFSQQLSLFLTGSTQYYKYVQLLSIQFLFIPISLLNQFFIIRYKFKHYIIGNIIGNILTVLLMIILLIRTHDISSYFYSAIIGQLFTTIYLVVFVFLKYRNPDFSVSFLELLKYAVPLYFGNILIYFRGYIYNIIFLKLVVNSTAPMGLLSYITTSFSVINSAFNSFNALLIVSYSNILYKEGSEREYTQLTYQLSRIYQILALITSFGFMLLSPIFIRFLTGIYKSPSLYSVGTITSILFGIYFFISTFYYIIPTVIVIHKTSYVLLLINGLATAVYLLGFFIFISHFGMIGIPIALSLGLISYIAIYYIDISWKFSIKKRSVSIGFKKIILYLTPFVFISILSFVLFNLILGVIITCISIFLIFIIIFKTTVQRRLYIGFDKKMFKKVIIISSIIIISIPLLYFYSKNDISKILITIGSFQFYLAINSIIVNLLVLFGSFVYFIIFSRLVHLFNQSDRNLFIKFLGNKIGKILSTLLISKTNKKHRKSSPI